MPPAQRLCPGVSGLSFRQWVYSTGNKRPLFQVYCVQSIQNVDEEGAGKIGHSLISGELWADFHGGVTHFPIATLIASLFFDVVRQFVKKEQLNSELRSASFYTLMLGALASFGAVLSGIMIARTRPNIGMLYYHHLFVWPAFGLIVGLAVWRIVVGNRASRQAYMVYLAVAFVAAGCVLGAAYWGGKLLGA